MISNQLVPMFKQKLYLSLTGFRPSQPRHLLRPILVSHLRPRFAPEPHSNPLQGLVSVSGYKVEQARFHGGSLSKIHLYVSQDGSSILCILQSRYIANSSLFPRTSIGGAGGRGRGGTCVPLQSQQRKKRGKSRKCVYQDCFLTGNGTLEHLTNV